MTGRISKKKCKNTANRRFKRQIMDLKNRGRDIDRIQDDIKKVEGGGDLGVADEDAPGGGLYYCIPCARHFVDGATLTIHCTSKVHKKRVKMVSEPQYTQKEADAGAGMSTADTARG